MVLRAMVFGFLCSLLVGCALLGITTGPDGQPVSDGKGGIVGGLLGTFLPWAGTAIAGVAGIYCDLKRRNWKAAFTSTAKTLQEFKATPQGAVVWEALKAKLGENQAAVAIQDFVDKYLAKANG